MNNMYPYNQYSVENAIDVNSAALYHQQQTSQIHSSGLPMSAPGPSNYISRGPGPIRTSPRSTHAPLVSTHRRISPDHILGQDAPTQPRNYITPSSTSRKDIPSMYLKRPRHQVMEEYEDEDDELTEEPLPPNATDQQRIEHKRRQNTLAARRSRKRKIMYQQQLEAEVQRLTIEKEMWRTRALTLRQLLHSHGHPCPDFKD